jgi:hypothetical protein
MARVCVLLFLGGCTFSPMGLPIGDPASDLSSLPQQDLAIAEDLPGADLSGADLKGNDLSQVPMDMTKPPDMTIVCGNGMAPAHIGELTEGNIINWKGNVLQGGSAGSATAIGDTAVKSSGTLSVQLETNSDYASLTYPTTHNAGWNLSGFTTLSFAVAAQIGGGGWQGNLPEVWLVTNDFQSGNDYYHYTPNTNLVPTAQSFATVTMPLAGGSGWARTSQGTPSLSNINYVVVGFKANNPSFRIWLDALQFGPGTLIDCTP